MAIPPPIGTGQSGVGVALVVLAVVCLATVVVLSALEGAMRRRPRPPDLGDGPHSRNGSGP